MGKIVRNGIEYCGTSDTADNIIYDNSSSGLEATTTQAAIDELAESFGGGGNSMTINEKLDKLLAANGIGGDEQATIYEIMNLGSEREINITDIVGAENIGFYNSDDFICEILATDGSNINWMAAQATVTLTALSVNPLIKTYDPTTGILTISGGTTKIWNYLGSTGTKVVEGTLTNNIVTYLKRKTSI